MLEVNYGMTLTPPICDAILLQNLRSLYLESFAFVQWWNSADKCRKQKHMAECELFYFSWRNLLQEKVEGWDVFEKEIDLILYFLMSVEKEFMYSFRKSNIKTASLGF